MAVEIAAILNSRRETSQRDRQFARDSLQDRKRRFIAMNVLMRVQVSRVTAHQAAKLFQLASDFFRHASLIRRDDLVTQLPFIILIDPFRKIHVQTNAQFGIASHAFGDLGCGRLANHQAGTGDDALLVAAEDSLIDTGTQTKVIRIDD